MNKNMETAQNNDLGKLLRRAKMGEVVNVERRAECVHTWMELEISEHLETVSRVNEKEIVVKVYSHSALLSDNPSTSDSTTFVKGGKPRFPPISGLLKGISNMFFNTPEISRADCSFTYNSLVPVSYEMLDEYLKEKGI